MWLALGKFSDFTSLILYTTTSAPAAQSTQGLFGGPTNVCSQD